MNALLLLLFAFVLMPSAFAQVGPVSLACEEVMAGGRTPFTDPEEHRDREDNIDRVPEEDNTPLDHDPMFPPEADDDVTYH